MGPSGTSRPARATRFFSRSSSMSPAREHAGDALRLGSPQQRADARQELRHRERLDDVIVGAGGEAAHALGLLAARGEHDDRQCLSFRARAQPPDQLDAGQARQHPVDDGEVRRVLLELEVRLVAAHRRLDGITLRLEIVAQEERQRLLVLDDQNSRRHSALIARATVTCGNGHMWNGTRVVAVLSPLGRSSGRGLPSTM